MNMKKILKNILLSALTITFVTSCADDRNNFLPDDSFGFNTLKDENVIKVPIYGGSYDLTVIKSGKGLNTGTAYFESSNKALLDYNRSFNTDFVPFPSDQDMYSFSENSILFTKDEVTKTVKLEWDVAKIGEYMKDEPDNDYAIPVVVKSEDLKINNGRHLYILNLVKSTINVENSVLSQMYQWGSPCKAAKKTLLVRIDTPIVGKDLEINFEADETAVADYNELYRETNKVDYELAPEGLVTFDSKIVIAGGEKYNKLTFNIDPTILLEKNEEGNMVAKEFNGYVLPVRIKSMSINDIQINNGLTYIVVKGTPPAKPQLFKRLWGIFATSSEDPWHKTFGLTDCRNITMDDQYIYIVQNTGGEAVLKAISITDPTQVINVNVDGTDKGGTHTLSCVRMLPKEDGTEVLIASNLTEGDAGLTFYVWHNGINNPPTAYNKLLESGRRLGDKFIVTGTWEKGEIYCKDYNTSNTVRYGMTGSDIGEWRDANGVAYARGRWDYSPAGDSKSIGSAYVYPGTANLGTGMVPYFMFSSANAGDWLTFSSIIKNEKGEDTSNANYMPSNKVNLKKTHGYNFFNVGGKEYIAWVSLDTKEEFSTKGFVHVIPNPTATAEGVVDALDAYLGAAEPLAAAVFPLQDELDSELSSPCQSSHHTGDCVVRTIGETTYMAAMIQNVGLSLFVLDPLYAGDL